MRGVAAASPPAPGIDSRAMALLVHGERRKERGEKKRGHSELPPIAWTPS